MHKTNEMISLRHQNVNMLPQSLLLYIFLYIPVKQILVYCRINKKFNTSCKKESFWKTKAMIEYGIDIQLNYHAELNWKQTVEHAHKHNMINLNHKWFNKSTYKQILYEALLEEYTLEYFTDLQDKYIKPYVAEGDTYDILYDTYENWDNLSKYSEIYIGSTYESMEPNEYARKQCLQDYGKKILGRNYTENELNDIAHIKCRELTIIYNVVRDIDSIMTRASQEWKDIIAQVIYYSSIRNKDRLRGITADI